MGRIVLAVAVSLVIGFIAGQRLQTPAPTSPAPVQATTTVALESSQASIPIECADEQSQSVDHGKVSPALTPASYSTEDTTEQSDYAATVTDASFGRELWVDTIKFAVSQLPQDSLMRLLEASIPYKKTELGTMNDPLSFAGRVAQLATGEDLGFGSSEVAADSTVTTFLLDDNFEEGVDLNVVKPKTTRIFSHFELPPGYERSDVLVKWYYADSNEVLSFRRQLRGRGLFDR